MHIYDKSKFIPNDFISVTRKHIRGTVAAHGHDFFEIEYFLSGDGTHEIDGVSYPIRPNSLFLLSPANVHSICSQNSEVITVMFQSEHDGVFFTFPLLSPSYSPAFYLEDIKAEVLPPLLLELFSVHKNDTAYAMLLLHCILHKLTACHNTYNDEALPLVQNTILYMLENFRGEITLESTASHFGFSKAYFSDLFLRQTGINFKAYLDGVRFSHAKNLLAFTTLPVSEIHTRAGFCDYANFARRFKQKYGLTPTEYRKKMNDRP